MQAQLRDALEFLYPDSRVEGPRVLPAAMDVPRGGTIAAHVLLTGLEEGATLRLAVRSGGRPLRSARWFRLIDVPVEENTGLSSFTEQWKNRPNPYVIRRAPFRVFDAMEPVPASLRVSGSTMALRLHLPVAQDERPGRRELEVRVSCGGKSASLPLRVAVHKVVVPPAGRESFPYTNWFSYENIATRHGLKLWSPAYWRMLRRYADLMARTRQNTFWIPLNLVFRKTPSGFKLDRQRLRRIVRLFTGAGLWTIEGGHLGCNSGGVMQSPTLLTLLGRQPATSPKGHAEIASLCRQLRTEIEASGWRDRWLQHAGDEPGGTNARDFRIFVGMIHKYLPGIPILDAVMTTEFSGSVDIWCPTNRTYQQNRAFFDAQRACGDRIWFYTCCGPGGPWLNRLLDMELIRPALYGWGAARFGLDGFLHWGLNHYSKGQDPFTRSIVVCGAAPRFLPAGDTHVVYPGKDGPWSSLRLEAQREGFEDLELLRRLQAKSPAAADRIVRGVFRSFDSYTKDVAVLRRARRALLKTISR